MSAPLRSDRIAALLLGAFAPSHIAVVDDSARHSGHAGAQPGGETHFNVTLASEAFRGMSRVERSRAVHAVLAPEFAGGLHALSLRLSTPDEKSSPVSTNP